MTTPYPIEEISEEEVNQAQRDWCDGLIEICEAYPDGDYRDKAIKFIERLYDFEGSRVIFPSNAGDGAAQFQNDEGRRTRVLHR